MKGIICYYSGSGNTELACQYIAKNVKNVEFELFDIVRADAPDLEQYDAVGFAAFTDFFGPSYIVRAFMEKLPRQNNKPAFVFNTYGFISGKTLKVFKGWAAAKGFDVIAGHSLHTPESYPPMIARGRANEQAPNEKEMKRFNGFISDLDGLLGDIKEGREIKRGLDISLLNRLLPVFSRTRARKDMGEKYVDEALCTECGTCEKLCPYDAIKLSPKPVFDMEKCHGCWVCYNHCPSKAIYTKKFRGVGHYPKPIDGLNKKLKV